MNEYASIWKDVVTAYFKPLAWMNWVILQNLGWVPRDEAELQQT
jgi:hypothetical protein